MQKLLDCLIKLVIALWLFLELWRKRRKDGG